MRRFLQFLRDPPLRFAAAEWFFALASVGGSIAAVSVCEGEAWTYAVYVLAALFLGYGIYLAVRLAPQMKRGIAERVNRHAVTSRFFSDYGFRTQAITLLSLIVNVGYALVHFVLAVLWRSLWYGALAGYYLLLSALRGGVLAGGRGAKKRAEGDAVRLLGDKWRIYRASGAALFLIEAALSVFVTQTVLFGRPQTPSLVMAIASAAYTFYRVILSLVQMRKGRKTGDPLVQSLRNINFSNALVSLFALQITLVAVQGGADEGMRNMNIFMGFFVCALTIALGLYMIVRASRKLGRMKADEAQAVPSGQPEEETDGGE